ncbi:hypothetical protein AN958_04508 [Leucoagaricus sp. SymC.cos]|nr:hypothetical protein AN958_04508 [Leucoagaricus sp. SymC.cos]
MLRVSVIPSQCNWVSRLPAIKFAINAARSEVMGYAPFFLNYGCILRSLIWNNSSKEEYSGVRTFTLKMKNTIMGTHNSIIVHCVKEIHGAN